MMKISNRHSPVLKSQMESIRYFVAQWVSLGEMKALQGVCMPTSVWARERQYEELLSDLDDQVWRDLSDDWQTISVGKRRKPRPVIYDIVSTRAARINATFSG